VIGLGGTGIVEGRRGYRGRYRFKRIGSVNKEVRGRIAKMQSQKKEMSR